MKKSHIFLTLIVALLLFLLCGCSSSNSAEEKPEELPNHKIYLDIDFEQNMLLATYDVEVFIDDTEVGTVEHGKNFTYLTDIKEGAHTITFYKATDNSVKSRKEIKVVEDTTYKFLIHSNSGSIDIKSFEAVSGISGNEITMIDVVGLRFDEAISKLRDAGFVNLKYKTPNDEDIWDESAWQVMSQNIESGEVIDKNSEIILSCDRPQTDTPAPSPDASPTPAPSSTDTASFHSSHDKDVAKNGNSGVFAYRSRGGSYYIYYIINFDEGYVYRFSDGNGESSCERVKIDSGNLNEYIVVTYHDGSDVWQNGLHFKFANRPDHLVVQDNDGLDWDFYAEDIDNALEILSTKTIKDY